MKWWIEKLSDRLEEESLGRARKSCIKYNIFLKISAVNQNCCIKSSISPSPGGLAGQLL